MLLETTQVVSQPDVIDFGIGQPQLNLLPRQLLSKAADQLLARPDCTPLNYGHGKGDGRFRQALSEFLSPGYGGPVDPGSFVTTGGASQALDFIAQRFAQPGDTILVEEPTYFLAHQIFSDRGLRAVGIPVGATGLDLEALEAAVREHRPAFFYTIPVFQNPTGFTLPPAHRRALIEMAQRHGFLIVADEVYQLLHYHGEAPPPPFASQLDSGVVLSVGSFSKILAPGLRLGWIQTCAELQEHILASGLLHSGGGLNHFVSCLVSQLLVNGSQGEYLQQLQTVYGGRVEAMDRALQTHLGDRIVYQRPEGGYFFWVQLGGGIDSQSLLPEATRAKVGFRAGQRFSSHGQLRDCLRLSFAHYDEEAIEVGVQRLASALQSLG